MRGSREWGPDPPPLKISNFLNYIVKLWKKRSWTPLPPGRDRYPSNPPSWKKILDPCMIYLFYVLMVYFYWSVTFMSSIHLFLPINAVHIKHFDDPMSIYVNGLDGLHWENLFYCESWAGLRLYQFACLWFIAAVNFYHFYSYLNIVKIKNVFKCFVSKKKIEHDVLKCMGLQIYEIVFMKVCNNRYYFFCE